MPILDADIGKAWLHLKDDATARACRLSAKVLENDPTNADIYVGLDAAMSLNGVSAKERATALGRYPISRNWHQLHHASESGLSTCI